MSPYRIYSRECGGFLFTRKLKSSNEQQDMLVSLEAVSRTVILRCGVVWLVWWRLRTWMVTWVSDVAHKFSTRFCEAHLA